MSLSALLLRVLLCVSLIANGIGFAHASTRMQLAHTSRAMHTSHTMHGARTAQSPAVAEECHPGMTMASHAGAPMPTMDHAAMSHDGAGHDMSTALADADRDDSSDCCSGTTCQCECTQHASAGFVADVVPGSTPAHSALAMRGMSQHASPRLPHLIRPPIG